MRPYALLLALTLLSCDGVIGALGEAEAIPTAPDPLAPVLEEFLCSPSQGFAPLKVQCKARASDKEGQVVRCQVSASDTLPSVELPECRTEQQFELTLPVPGSYAVRAQAIDTDGLIALRTQAIEVTERPNLPPLVDGFVASVNGAAVPMATTLSWTASDPDADALTCEVDVGDDGTVDQTFTGAQCAAGSMPHAVTQAGSVVVRLTVTDGHGGKTEKTLTLTARLVTGEVAITGVEWMQTIVKENLKLVANKTALLRVYVIADRAGLQGVRLAGEAFQAGASVGKLTFTAPASPPTASPNTDLTKQYVAEVPAAMVAAGLEIRLEADADDAVAETDEQNNLRTLTPNVGAANVLELTAVPVVHQGTTSSTPAVEPTMTRLWPMSKVNTQVRAPFTWSGALSGGDGSAWSNLLQDIGTLRQADGSRRQYYGWVKVGYGSGIAGIGYIGQPAATGRDDSLSTFAHEKGHNLGRPHAPCGGAAGPDPGYPYAGGTIGSWGYDAVNKRLINPSSTYRDLMSYCDPEWVSDYNYGKVQTFMETQPDYLGGTAPDQLSLVVSGAFRGGKWELRPVHRVWAAPTAVEDGPLALRLRTLDGKERVVPFRTWEVEDTGDNLGEVHFSLVVADPGALAALEVVSGTEVLARRAGVPSPASVAPALERVDENTVRVVWDAATHPSLAVGFLEGDTRTTLALDLHGGDALVRTDGLPRAGAFELSVSDGLNPVRRAVPVR